MHFKKYALPFWIRYDLFLSDNLLLLNLHSFSYWHVIFFYFFSSGIWLRESYYKMIFRNEIRFAKYVLPFRVSDNLILNNSIFFRDYLKNTWLNICQLLYWHVILFLGIFLREWCLKMTFCKKFIRKTVKIYHWRHFFKTWVNRSELAIAWFWFAVCPSNINPQNHLLTYLDIFKSLFK